jgi:pimeloyl-CoA synthetase
LCVSQAPCFSVLVALFIFRTFGFHLPSSIIHLKFVSTENKSTKKLLQDAGIEDDEVKKAFKEAHDATDKAGDLVLNIRTLMTNMGGLDYIHNINMDSFTVKRNHSDPD